MSNLIERVAIALADEGGFRWGDLQDVPYSVFDDGRCSRLYWLALARAAIGAMRETSGEKKEAGVKAEEAAPR